MLKIENLEVVNLHKVLSFRNSFDSHDKSDSSVSRTHSTGYVPIDNESNVNCESLMWPTVYFGSKDLAAFKRLVLNGDSHAKTLRKVIVSMRMTAPRRVWVDFDTYRLGRECDIEMMSDSTMHTINRRLLDEDDFSPFTDSESIAVVNRKIAKYQKIQQELRELPTGALDWSAKRESLMVSLESAFLEIKDNLGEGFYQARDVSLSYQTCRHIYFDRERHRQPELRQFCEMIASLPYAKDLIICKAD